MAYLKCLANCGTEPGLTVPLLDSTLNWLGNSTADQLRIEEVLATQVTPNSRLLHVGIGNSGLAKRFYKRVCQIEGITLGRREEEVAVVANISNYHVHLVNKYSEDLPTRLQPPFNFIIDNNLASYACCVHHFHSMMQNYVSMLLIGGKILSDRIGLRHVANDENWDLTGDLEALAKHFSLKLTAETDFVYSFTHEL